MMMIFNISIGYVYYIPHYEKMGKLIFRQEPFRLFTNTYSPIRNKVLENDCCNLSHRLWIRLISYLFSQCGQEFFLKTHRSQYLG